MATKPAGRGSEVSWQGVGTVVPYGHGPWLLAKGALRVLKSTPEDAVVSLEMIVLLRMFTANASTSEIPAPSQPATLLAMMLLVTSIEFHLAGCVGKVVTSVPLTPWKRMPPPLPLSAALPIIRFALISRPGPTPSPGGLTLVMGGKQSASVVIPHAGSTSGAPMMRRPPPLLAIVGLELWLNMIVLCSMRPFQL